MLRYLKQFKGENEWNEITKDDALRTVIGSYRDCDMTRDFLEGPNYIPCLFSTISVQKVTEHGVLVPMAGMQCVAPDGAEYDDCGNRI